MALASPPPRIVSSHPAIRGFDTLRAHDAPIAGGKGAQLGELAATGLPTPPGFVVCADAWRDACRVSGFDARLEEIFTDLDHADPVDLEQRCEIAVREAAAITIPLDLQDAIIDCWHQITDQMHNHASVIVRSSATLEDSSIASFAGMHRSYAHVVDAQQVLDAVRGCWASMYTPRTVFYRVEHGLPVAASEIAVVIQQYIPATRAGVMFTLDPATGDTSRMIIEAAFGGGEAVVSGRVTPDRYVVSRHPLNILQRDIHAKQIRTVDNPSGGTSEEDVALDDVRRPALNDLQILEIARLGVRIDMHYAVPQDIEWLIDEDGRLWIVQSRPVTGPSATTLRAHVAAPSIDTPHVVSVEPQSMTQTPAETITQGVGASAGVVSGPVRKLDSPQQGGVLAIGDILVARMTAPDWAPVMRRAAAIVTDQGGVTCHAAIVARELGIPCVVGTGNATQLLHDGHTVTVDGSRGLVSVGSRPSTPTIESAPTVADAPAVLPARPPGAHPWSDHQDIAGPIVTATDVMVNVSSPHMAEKISATDCDGIGLIRAEQMIVEALNGQHPLKLIEDGNADEAIATLAASITTFCTAFAPRPVTYRTIDFRTSEFRNLAGGDQYEPIEANPMIGFRGAGRYARQPELLHLEARAIRQVVESGITNLRIMLPFVRTPRDVMTCIDILAREGLLLGSSADGTGAATQPMPDLWIMAEVPSVLWHLPIYQQLGVRGISIGTNDLTQLLLGADRDSADLGLYDATDPAVLGFITDLVDVARNLGMSTSICGQAPSIYPEYAQMLIHAGIDSISVTPDALETARRHVARAEQRMLLDHLHERNH